MIHARILITGGCGFIGSAFLLSLLSEKNSFSGVCVNVDALTYAANDLLIFNALENDPRYFFYHHEINDKEALLRICEQHQIDTIVNFAAETHVDRSLVSSERFLYSNVLGTVALLEVVRTFPHIHLHHISTDEVYGALGTRGKFDLDAPYAPNSPYSASKASADHFLRAYQMSYQISASVSYCSNNYGPRQHREKLIPKVITSALQGKEIPIYGRGKQMREWLYVDDHVLALTHILSRRANGKKYHVSTGEEHTNLSLVETILAQMAPKVGSSYEDLRRLIRFVPDRQGHDFRYALDCASFAAETGWKPRYSLSEGLALTIDWYLGHQAEKRCR